MKRSIILLLFPIVAACSKPVQPKEVLELQSCLGQKVDSVTVQSLVSTWGFSTPREGWLVSPTNGVTLLYHSNIVWRAFLHANPPSEWNGGPFRYPFPFGLSRTTTPENLAHHLGDPDDMWKDNGKVWRLFNENGYEYVFIFQSNTWLGVWIDESGLIRKESNKRLQQRRSAVVEP